MADQSTSQEPVQYVWVAVDRTSRWFELFRNESDAIARVDELNERYRTSRYSLALVPINNGANT